MLVASEKEIKQAIFNCINKRLEKCIPIEKIENYIKSNLETWEKIGNKEIIDYILELEKYVYEINKVILKNNQYNIQFHAIQGLYVDTYSLNDTRNLFKAIINYIKSEVKNG